MASEIKKLSAADLATLRELAQKGNPWLESQDLLSALRRGDATAEKVQGIAKQLFTPEEATQFQTILKGSKDEELSRILQDLLKKIAESSKDANASERPPLITDFQDRLAALLPDGSKVTYGELVSSVTEEYLAPALLAQASEGPAFAVLKKELSRLAGNDENKTNDLIRQLAGGSEEGLQKAIVAAQQAAESFNNLEDSNPSLSIPKGKAHYVFLIPGQSEPLVIREGDLAAEIVANLEQYKKDLHERIADPKNIFNTEFAYMMLTQRLVRGSLDAAAEARIEAALAQAIGKDEIDALRKKWDEDPATKGKTEALLIEYKKWRMQSLRSELESLEYAQIRSRTDDPKSAIKREIKIARLAPYLEKIPTAENLYEPIALAQVKDPKLREALQRILASLKRMGLNVFEEKNFDVLDLIDMIETLASGPLAMDVAFDLSSVIGHVDVELAKKEVFDRLTYLLVTLPREIAGPQKVEARILAPDGSVFREVKTGEIRSRVDRIVAAKRNELMQAYVVVISTLQVHRKGLALGLWKGDEPVASDQASLAKQINAIHEKLGADQGKAWDESLKADAAMLAAKGLDALKQKLQDLDPAQAEILARETAMDIESIFAQELKSVVSTEIVHLYFEREGLNITSDEIAEAIKMGTLRNQRQGKNEPYSRKEAIEERKRFALLAQWYPEVLQLDPVKDEEKLGGIAQDFNQLLSDLVDDALLANMPTGSIPDQKLLSDTAEQMIQSGVLVPRDNPSGVSLKRAGRISLAQLMEEVGKYAAFVEGLDDPSLDPAQVLARFCAMVSHASSPSKNGEQNGFLAGLGVLVKLQERKISLDDVTVRDLAVLAKSDTLPADLQKSLEDILASVSGDTLEDPLIFGQTKIRLLVRTNGKVEAKIIGERKQNRLLAHLLEGEHAEFWLEEHFEPNKDPIEMAKRAHLYEAHGYQSGEFVDALYAVQGFVENLKKDFFKSLDYDPGKVDLNRLLEMNSLPRQANAALAKMLRKEMIDRIGQNFEARKSVPLDQWLERSGFADLKKELGEALQKRFGEKLPDQIAANFFVTFWNDPQRFASMLQNKDPHYWQILLPLELPAEQSLKVDQAFAALLVNLQKTIEIYQKPGESESQALAAFARDLSRSGFIASDGETLIGADKVLSAIDMMAINVFGLDEKTDFDKRLKTVLAGLRDRLNFVTLRAFSLWQQRQNGKPTSGFTLDYNLLLEFAADADTPLGIRAHLFNLFRQAKTSSSFNPLLRKDLSLVCEVSADGEKLSYKFVSKESSELGQKLLDGRASEAALKGADEKDPTVIRMQAVVTEVWRRAITLILEKDYRLDEHNQLKAADAAAVQDTDFESLICQVLVDSAILDRQEATKEHALVKMLKGSLTPDVSTRLHAFLDDAIREKAKGNDQDWRSLISRYNIPPQLISALIQETEQVRLAKMVANYSATAPATEEMDRNTRTVLFEIATAPEDYQLLTDALNQADFNPLAEGEISRAQYLVLKFYGTLLHRLGLGVEVIAQEQQYQDVKGEATKVLGVLLREQLKRILPRLGFDKLGDAERKKILQAYTAQNGFLKGFEIPLDASLLAISQSRDSKGIYLEIDHAQDLHLSNEDFLTKEGGRSRALAQVGSDPFWLKLQAALSAIDQSNRRSAKGESYTAWAQDSEGERIDYTQFLQLAQRFMAVDVGDKVREISERLIKSAEPYDAVSQRLGEISKLVGLLENEALAVTSLAKARGHDTGFEENFAHLAKDLAAKADDEGFNPTLLKFSKAVGDLYNHFKGEGAYEEQLAADGLDYPADMPAHQREVYLRLFTSLRIYKNYLENFRTKKVLEDIKLLAERMERSGVPLDAATKAYLVSGKKSDIKQLEPKLSRQELLALAEGLETTCNQWLMANATRVDVAEKYFVENGAYDLEKTNHEEQALLLRHQWEGLKGQGLQYRRMGIQDLKAFAGIPKEQVLHLALVQNKVVGDLGGKYNLSYRLVNLKFEGKDSSPLVLRRLIAAFSQPFKSQGQEDTIDRIGVADAISRGEWAEAVATLLGRLGGEAPVESFLGGTQAESSLIPIASSFRLMSRNQADENKAAPIIVPSSFEFRDLTEKTLTEHARMYNAIQAAMEVLGAKDGKLDGYTIADVIRELEPYLQGKKYKMIAFDGPRSGNHQEDRLLNAQVFTCNEDGFFDDRDDASKEDIVTKIFRGLLILTTPKTDREYQNLSTPLESPPSDAISLRARNDFYDYILRTRETGMDFDQVAQAANIFSAVNQLLPAQMDAGQRKQILEASAALAQATWEELYREKAQTKAGTKKDDKETDKQPELAWEKTNLPLAVLLESLTQKTIDSVKAKLPGIDPQLLQEVTAAMVDELRKSCIQVFRVFDSGSFARGEARGYGKQLGKDLLDLVRRNEAAFFQDPSGKLDHLTLNNSLLALLLRNLTNRSEIVERAPGERYAQTFVAKTGKTIETRIPLLTQKPMSNIAIYSFFNRVEVSGSAEERGVATNLNRVTDILCNLHDSLERMIQPMDYAQQLEQLRYLQQNLPDHSAEKISTTAAQRVWEGLMTTPQFPMLKRYNMVDDAKVMRAKQDLYAEEIQYLKTNGREKFQDAYGEEMYYFLHDTSINADFITRFIAAFPDKFDNSISSFFMEMAFHDQLVNKVLAGRHPIEFLRDDYAAKMKRLNYTRPSLNVNHTNHADDKVAMLILQVAMDPMRFAKSEEPVATTEGFWDSAISKAKRILHHEFQPVWVMGENLVGEQEKLYPVGHVILTFLFQNGMLSWADAADFKKHVLDPVVVQKCATVFDEYLAKYQTQEQRALLIRDLDVQKFPFKGEDTVAGKFAYLESLRDALKGSISPVDLKSLGEQGSTRLAALEALSKFVMPMGSVGQEQSFNPGLALFLAVGGRRVTKLTTTHRLSDGSLENHEFPEGWGSVEERLRTPDGDWHALWEYSLADLIHLYPRFVIKLFLFVNGIGKNPVIAIDGESAEIDDKEITREDLIALKDLFEKKEFAWGSVAAHPEDVEALKALIIDMESSQAPHLTVAGIGKDFYSRSSFLAGNGQAEWMAPFVDPLDKRLVHKAKDTAFKWFFFKYGMHFQIGLDIQMGLITRMSVILGDLACGNLRKAFDAFHEMEEWAIKRAGFYGFELNPLVWIVDDVRALLRGEWEALIPLLTLNYGFIRHVTPKVISKVENGISWLNRRTAQRWFNAELKITHVKATGGGIEHLFGKQLGEHAAVGLGRRMAARMGFDGTVWGSTRGVTKVAIESLINPLGEFGVLRLGGKGIDRSIAGGRWLLNQVDRVTTRGYGSYGLGRLLHGQAQGSATAEANFLYWDLLMNDPHAKISVETRTDGVVDAMLEKLRNGDGRVAKALKGLEAKAKAAGKLQAVWSAGNWLLRNVMGLKPLKGIVHQQFATLALTDMQRASMHLQQSVTRYNQLTASFTQDPQFFLTDIDPTPDLLQQRQEVLQKIAQQIDAQKEQFKTVKAELGSQPEKKAELTALLEYEKQFDLQARLVREALSALDQVQASQEAWAELILRDGPQLMEKHNAYLEKLAKAREGNIASREPELQDRTTRLLKRMQLVNEMQNLESQTKAEKDPSKRPDGEVLRDRQFKVLKSGLEDGVAALTSKLSEVTIPESMAGMRDVLQGSLRELQEALQNLEPKLGETYDRVSSLQELIRGHLEQLSTFEGLSVTDRGRVMECRAFLELQIQTRVANLGDFIRGVEVKRGTLTLRLAEELKNLSKELGGGDLVDYEAGKKAFEERIKMLQEEFAKAVSGELEGTRSQEAIQAECDQLFEGFAELDAIQAQLAELKGNDQLSLTLTERHLLMQEITDAVDAVEEKHIELDRKKRSGKINADEYDAQKRVLNKESNFLAKALESARQYERGVSFTQRSILRSLYRNTLVRPANFFLGFGPFQFNGTKEVLDFTGPEIIEFAIAKNKTEWLKRMEAEITSATQETLVRHVEAHAQELAEEPLREKLAESVFEGLADAADSAQLRQRYEEIVFGQKERKLRAELLKKNGKETQIDSTQSRALAQEARALARAIPDTEIKSKLQEMVMEGLGEHPGIEALRGRYVELLSCLGKSDLHGLVREIVHAEVERVCADVGKNPRLRGALLSEQKGYVGASIAEQKVLNYLNEQFCQALLTGDHAAGGSLGLHFHQGLAESKRAEINKAKQATELLMRFAANPDTPMHVPLVTSSETKAGLVSVDLAFEPRDFLELVVKEIPRAQMMGQKYPRTQIMGQYHYDERSLTHSIKRGIYRLGLGTSAFRRQIENLGETPYYPDIGLTYRGKQILEKMLNQNADRLEQLAEYGKEVHRENHRRNHMHNPQQVPEAEPRNFPPQRELAMMALQNIIGEQFTMPLQKIFPAKFLDVVFLNHNPLGGRLRSVMNQCLLEWKDGDVSGLRGKVARMLGELKQRVDDSQTANQAKVEADKLPPREVAESPEAKPAEEVKAPAEVPEPSSDVPAATAPSPEAAAVELGDAHEALAKRIHYEGTNGQGEHKFTVTNAEFLPLARGGVEYTGKGVIAYKSQQSAAQDFRAGMRIGFGVAFLDAFMRNKLGMDGHAGEEMNFLEIMWENKGAISGGTIVGGLLDLASKSKLDVTFTLKSENGVLKMLNLTFTAKNPLYVNLARRYTEEAAKYMSAGVVGASTGAVMALAQAAMDPHQDMLSLQTGQHMLSATGNGLLLGNLFILGDSLPKYINELGKWKSTRYASLSSKAAEWRMTQWISKEGRCINPRVMLRGAIKMTPGLALGYAWEKGREWAVGQVDGEHYMLRDAGYSLASIGVGRSLIGNGRIARACLEGRNILFGAPEILGGSLVTFGVIELGVLSLQPAINERADFEAVDQSIYTNLAVERAFQENGVFLADTIAMKSNANVAFASFTNIITSLNCAKRNETKTPVAIQKQITQAFELVKTAASDEQWEKAFGGRLWGYVQEQAQTFPNQSAYEAFVCERLSTYFKIDSLAGKALDFTQDEDRQRLFDHVEVISRLASLYDSAAFLTADREPRKINVDSGIAGQGRTREDEVARLLDPGNESGLNRDGSLNATLVMLKEQRVSALLVSDAVLQNNDAKEVEQLAPYHFKRTMNTAFDCHSIANQVTLVRSEQGKVGIPQAILEDAVTVITLPQDVKMQGENYIRKWVFRIPHTNLIRDGKEIPVVLDLTQGDDGISDQVFVPFLETLAARGLIDQQVEKTILSRWLKAKELGCFPSEQEAYAALREQCQVLGLAEKIKVLLDDWTKGNLDLRVLSLKSQFSLPDLQNILYQSDVIDGAAAELENRLLALFGVSSYEIRSSGQNENSAKPYNPDQLQRERKIYDNRDIRSLADYILSGFEFKIDEFHKTDSLIVRSLLPMVAAAAEKQGLIEAGQDIEPQQVFALLKQLKDEQGSVIFPGEELTISGIETLYRQPHVHQAVADMIATQVRQAKEGFTQEIGNAYALESEQDRKAMVDMQVAQFEASLQEIFQLDQVFSQRDLTLASLTESDWVPPLEGIRDQNPKLAVELLDALEKKLGKASYSVMFGEVVYDVKLVREKGAVRVEVRQNKQLHQDQEIPDRLYAAILQEGWVRAAEAADVLLRKQSASQTGVFVSTAEKRLEWMKTVNDLLPKVKSLAQEAKDPNLVQAFLQLENEWMQAQTSQGLAERRTVFARLEDGFSQLRELANGSTDFVRLIDARLNQVRCDRQGDINSLVARCDTTKGNTNLAYLEENPAAAQLEDLRNLRVRVSTLEIFRYLKIQGQIADRLKERGYLQQDWSPLSWSQMLSAPPEEREALAQRGGQFQDALNGFLRDEIGHADENGLLDFVEIDKLIGSKAVAQSVKNKAAEKPASVALADRKELNTKTSQVWQRLTAIRRDYV